MSRMLSLVEHTDRILLIREVLLQLKHIMIHFLDRIFEAEEEQRHMEDIMNLRKVQR